MTVPNQPKQLSHYITTESCFSFSHYSWLDSVIPPRIGPIQNLNFMAFKRLIKVWTAWMTANYKSLTHRSYWGEVYSESRKHDVNYQFQSLLSGVYLAFRETGMCAFILSIQVYYKRCPATVIRHTELASVPTGSSLTTVTGRYVNSTHTYTYTCTLNTRPTFLPMFSLRNLT